MQATNGTVSKPANMKPSTRDILHLYQRNLAHTVTGSPIVWTKLLSISTEVAVVWSDHARILQKPIKILQFAGPIRDFTVGASLGGRWELFTNALRRKAWRS
jgi:hypothetical protein